MAKPSYIAELVRRNDPDQEKLPNLGKVLEQKLSDSKPNSDVTVFIGHNGTHQSPLLIALALS